MATRTELSLPEANVERVELDDQTLRIHLREFFTFVSLTGSSEQTQWRQSGVLILENAKLDHELPQGAVVLAGGDIHDNSYTYRDRVPLPLDTRGQVGCTLHIAGSHAILAATGTRLRLETVGERRYMAHVR